MTVTMSVDQIDDVLKRWRYTPEGGFKSEDHQGFMTICSTLFDQGDSTKLLQLLQDDQNEKIVRSMGCDILTPLVSEVISKGKRPNPCHTALIYLTQVCNPDELLNGLLELLKDVDPDLIADTITALVPHLQTVLLRMGEDKAVWLGLALSALQKQVSRLPVPYTLEQEKSDAHGLCRCCTALTGFVQPFVEEVRRKDGRDCDATSGDDALKTELLKFCMGSLREPLLQAQLDHKSKSPLWLFASDILVTLLAIQEPLADLLFYSPLRKSSLMDDTESQESRACLAYLLFVKLIAIESFPAVFSPVFVLQCNMEHINLLLSRKNESCLLKGLALYETSLHGVEDNTLPMGLLELKSFYSVPQNLLQVLTDCPIQHLREKGLKVFQLFIDKLSIEAKHTFFRCILKTSHHAGVEGFIIKNIKNQVGITMKTGNGSQWFLGVDFLPLLGMVLCLPQGPETDLLQGMDRIMESLNLLRYLLLRDKEWRSNRGVWKELCKMKDDYLKLLRVCLSISRSYYASEVKALREDQKIKAKEARDAARSTKLVKRLAVRHEKEADMSPEVQHQVLQSALVTFDLMESLIVRIEEITEEHTESQ